MLLIHNLKFNYQELNEYRLQNGIIISTNMIIKDSGRHITFYKTLTESPFQRNKPRNDRDI